MSAATAEKTTWLVNADVYADLQEYLELLIYLRDSQF